MLGLLPARIASIQLCLLLPIPPPKIVESIPGKPCHTVLRSVFRLDMKSANFLALTSNCLDDNNLSRSGIPVWVAAVVLVGEEEICSPLFCFHGLLESCMLMCQVRVIQLVGCPTCWQGGAQKSLMRGEKDNAIQRGGF
tara:strand:+ start:176 stop:592 length:417 start_codon:yes stop_codon:yes gene_type:complete